MADPKLEEFCRAHDFKPSFLRDMQRYIRDEVQPKLEERERLIVEVESLRHERMAKASLRRKPEEVEVTP